MKIFQDLFIRLQGHSVEEFVDGLTGCCQLPWTRAIDKEEELPSLESRMYCFERSADHFSMNAS